MSTSSKDSRPAFGTSGPTDRVAKCLRELGYIHSSEQREQRKAAGKKSALTRENRGNARLCIITAAYALLDERFKDQPTSKASIDALEGAYYFIMGTNDPSSFDPNLTPLTELTEEQSPHVARGLLTYHHLSENDRMALERVSSETLKKGLGQLGIKGRRGQNRSR